MGDDKRALLAAVAAAAAAAAGSDGDESAAERYESLLAYVKRHSSRYVWWRWFGRCDSDTVSLALIGPSRGGIAGSQQVARIDVSTGGK